MSFIGVTFILVFFSFEFNLFYVQKLLFFTKLGENFIFFPKFFHIVTYKKNHIF